MYSRGAMISESLAYEKMFAFIEIYTKNIYIINIIICKHVYIYIYIYIRYRFEIFIKRFVLNKNCHYNSTFFVKHIDFKIFFFYNSSE